jgi:hypothetical protein
LDSPTTYTKQKGTYGSMVQIEAPQLKLSVRSLILGFSRLTLQLGLLALVPTLAWPQGTYTTNFPLIENPISEGGRWTNGGTVGLDWNNVQTTGGFAGGVGPAAVAYSDPTAILTGNWGPNQTVSGTVSSVGASDNYYQEVELRLRSTVSAHSITGYEVNFRTPNNGSAYVNIVRWNGALGNFTYVAMSSGTGVSNGDVVMATINGSTISAYVNGKLIVSGTDTTYTSGNPGIGINYGCGNTYSNFGFTSFTATDGTTGTNPSFALSATPASQTVTAGTNTTYTLSVTPSGGFTGSVGLSAAGLPTGSTASFNPSSITTSGTSTLTVTTGSSTPAASYPLSITGSSGSLSQTAPAALVVTGSGSGSPSPTNPCALTGDATVSSADIQAAINMSIGISSCNANIAGPNVCNAIVVQRVVNASMGQPCLSSTGLHVVSLSWTASTSSGVTGYQIARGTATTGPFTAIATVGNASTYIDTTVVSGATYYYVVAAVVSGTIGPYSSPGPAAVVPTP